MVRFVEMSRPEARAFLERFLAETPGRLQALREQCSSTGGPSAQSLDLTPDSLDPLWSWAAPRLAWRDGYQSPPPGEPGGRVPLDQLEPEDQLPSWFDPVVSGWARWSAESLWLLDGLARYLGETVLASVPGARWTAGHARRRGYAYENHPVLTGLPAEDIAPVWSTAIVAARALQPGPGPASLKALHDVWVTGA